MTKKNTLQPTEPSVPNTELYMPQLVYSWKSLNVDNFGVKLPITTYPGMGKYWTPVFETKEECEKEYPDCDIAILKRGYQ